MSYSISVICYKFYCAPKNTIKCKVINNCSGLIVYAVSEKGFVIFKILFKEVITDYAEQEIHKIALTSSSCPRTSPPLPHTRPPLPCDRPRACPL